MKKKCFVVTIIALVVLLLVMYNESLDILGTDLNVILSWKTQAIGYSIACMLSLVAIVLAVISIIKSDTDAKIKKIQIVVFILANILMVGTLLGGYSIDMFIFIVMGIIEYILILKSKEKNIEKLKLLGLLLLITAIVYYSMWYFLMEVWSLDDYKNTSMRIDNETLMHTANLSQSVLDYEFEQISANSTIRKFNELNKLLDKLVKKYNKEFKSNLTKADIVKNYCKTDTKTEITTKKEAYNVVTGQIREYMAFEEDLRDYYNFDFKGELLNLVRKYELDTSIFYDEDSKFLNNIVTDQNGNLYINPSSFLFIPEQE